MQKCLPFLKTVFRNTGISRKDISEDNNAHSQITFLNRGRPFLNFKTTLNIVISSYVSILEIDEDNAREAHLTLKSLCVDVKCKEK